MTKTNASNYNNNIGLIDLTTCHVFPSFDSSWVNIYVHSVQREMAETNNLLLKKFLLFKTIKIPFINYF